MYNNIGKKIKTLAIVFAIIEAAGSIIGGLVLLVEALDYDEDMIPVALLLLIVGPLFAWISSWMFYGFGELIEKVTIIARNTRNGEIKSETQERIDEERIRNLEKLRAQGLISEDEFKQKIING